MATRRATNTLKAGRTTVGGLPASMKAKPGSIASAANRLNTPLQTLRLEQSKPMIVGYDGTTATAKLTPEQAQAKQRADAMARVLGGQEWSDLQQRNQATYNQGIGELDRQDKYATEDFDAAKIQNTKALGQNRTATTRAANKQGLLYSGTLGTRLGEVEAASVERGNELQRGYDRGVAERGAARTSLSDALRRANGDGLSALVERAIKESLDAPIAEDEAPSESVLDSLARALGIGGGAKTTPPKLNLSNSSRLRF